MKLHFLVSLAVSAALAFSLTSYASEPTLVRFAWQKDDRRYEDLHHILQRAMALTEPAHGPYRLERITLPMSESRQIETVKGGKRLDLIWTSTSVKKEQELLAVKVPLKQGLLGYRLLIIHQTALKEWRQISTLSQLQQKIMVQGIGWGDIALYEHAHIKVIPLRYELAFKAVHLGKVDAFPRSITEIFQEVEKYAQEFDHLKVEPTLSLYYPWPYYFFVKKDNWALHKRLRDGLERMVLSGELRNIAVTYHADAIRKADLNNRRVIVLENPLLPESTPIDRPDYWYKLQ